MNVKEAIQQLQKKGYSKYKIAKEVGVQQIMISHYLGDTKVKIKTPTIKVGVGFYKAFGLVIFPFNEDELKKELENVRNS